MGGSGLAQLLRAGLVHPVQQLGEPVAAVRDVFRGRERHLGDVHDFDGVEDQGLRAVEILDPPHVAGRRVADAAIAESVRADNLPI